MRETRLASDSALEQLRTELARRGRGSILEAQGTLVVHLRSHDDGRDLFTCAQAHGVVFSATSRYEAMGQIGQHRVEIRSRITLEHVITAAAETYSKCPGSPQAVSAMLTSGEFGSLPTVTSAAGETLEVLLGDLVTGMRHWGRFGDDDMGPIDLVCSLLETHPDLPGVAEALTDRQAPDG